MKYIFAYFLVVCFMTPLLATLISCTGPSEGVTVYEEPQFEGGSRTFDESERNLRLVSGPCNKDSFSDDESGDFDKCISSIIVDEGWSATLHSGSGYSGEILHVRSGEFIGYLGDVKGGCGDDWNDCASSITVRRE
jgi:hypothetical protein